MATTPSLLDHRCCTVVESSEDRFVDGEGAEVVSVVAGAVDSAKDPLGGTRVWLREVAVVAFERTTTTTLQPGCRNGQLLNCVFCCSLEVAAS